MFYLCMLKYISKHGGTLCRTLVTVQYSSLQSQFDLNVIKYSTNTRYFIYFYKCMLVITLIPTTHIKNFGQVHKTFQVEKTYTGLVSLPMSNVYASSFCIFGIGTLMTFRCSEGLRLLLDYSPPCSFSHSGEPQPTLVFEGLSLLRTTLL